MELTDKDVKTLLERCPTCQEGRGIRNKRSEKYEKVTNGPLRDENVISNKKNVLDGVHSR